MTREFTTLIRNFVEAEASAATALAKDDEDAYGDALAVLAYDFYEYGLDIGELAGPGTGRKPIEASILQAGDATVIRLVLEPFSGSVDQQVLHFRRTSGRWRVFCIEVQCNTCDGTGIAGLRECPACAGAGVSPLRGKRWLNDNETKLTGLTRF